MSGHGDCFTATVSAMLPDPSYRNEEGGVSPSLALDVTSRMHAIEPRGDKVKLVHGLVYHPETDWHTHAWIELFPGFGPVLVLDVANGNSSVWPRGDYYRAGQISEQSVKRYTRIQMCALITRHEHYGPW